jgi:helix-turn-helix protein
MTKKPAAIEPLWTVNDTAAFLRVPVKTLYQWHWRGEGPPVQKVGRHLRYEPAQVRRWVASNGSKAA